MRLVLLLVCLVGVGFAGCMVEEGLTPEERAAEERAARLAELETEYQNGTGRLVGLEGFPSGADWVTIDLVVVAETPRLALQVKAEDWPDAPATEVPAPACLTMYYQDVGGWVWSSGDGYAIDAHAGIVPAPEVDLMAPSEDDTKWAFEDLEPLVDHRVVVGVDDAAAWSERGHGFGIEVVGDHQVYWRIADHGTGRCAQHFADHQDGGVGARVAGAGAAVDLYDRWTTDTGGLLLVLWHADVRYHVYVAWQDQYALAEWDSEGSLASGGGYVLPIGVTGAIGLYAPILVGTQDTELFSFYLDGYAPLE